MDPGLPAMATPGSPQGLQLFDLPNEVLGLIAKHVNQELNWNGVALKNFRLTCKQAASVAESAWCQYIRVTNPIRYEQLNSFLIAQPRRRYQVHSLDMHLFQGGFEKSESILSLISRFPNLQSLTFRDCLGYMYGDPSLCMLDLRLETTAFSELRECYLKAGAYEVHRPKLTLEHLLQAPKLRALALCMLDLTKFRATLVANHSTVLTKLKLLKCDVDRQSLMALLGSPRKLKSFHFGGLRPPVIDPARSPMTEALLSVQIVLETIGIEQPDLATLRITGRDGHLLHVSPKGFVNFRQCKNLKALSLGGYGGLRRWATGEEGSRVWCPALAFETLPSSVECIKLRPTSGNVDLEQLAAELAGPRNIGEQLPAALRQLDVVIDYPCRSLFSQDTFLPQRPWNKGDQVREDSLQRGIDRMMTTLPLQVLTYAECRELEKELCYDEDDSVEHEDSSNCWQVRRWFRKITASRQHTNNAFDMTKLNAKPYDLTEETWEEYHMVQEYYQDLASDMEAY